MRIYTIEPKIGHLPQIGAAQNGQYFKKTRIKESHEILLTAVLANRNDRFDDQSLRSWIEAPRGRHSEKPDVVREMIERASPGPRLELFARKLVPGWFTWGHEISESLTDQTAA